MLRKGLSLEVRWLLVYLAALAFVGYSLNHLRDILLLGLLAYIAWFFYRVSQLEHWILQVRRGTFRDHMLFGIWGEIAEDVKLLHNRYEKDRLRLQAVVAKVQDMTSALNDGVLLIDSRANLEWWNAAATTMFGFKEIDHGRRVTNIIRDPRFAAYFESGLYDEPLDVESTRREGQHLQFQINRYGQGELLVVVREVTRVFKLEQMRRDFVANVSHELRTPLTVIRGYVETLRDAPDISPVMNRALEQMQSQCQRMTALSNDLIMLTKLETDDRNLHTDEVNLYQLVKSVFNDARALSNGKHRFENALNEKLCVLGSEKELRSALSNLVVNAVKYSPDGCLVRVWSDSTSEHLQIHVQDGGIGIDPKHIPRLTERFYRVDSGRSTDMGGTGLGLAIVKHILLRHDAYLSIRSQIGKGSTFSCCFPIERIIEESAEAV